MWLLTRRPWPPYQPAAAMVPSPMARSGVPVGTAQSTPLCIRPQRMPKPEVNVAPETGLTQRPELLTGASLSLSDDVAGAAERLLERLTESRLEVDRSEVLLRSLLPRAERELDEWSCSDCAGAAERVGSGAFACWPTESWTGSGLGFGAGCS